MQRSLQHFPESTHSWYWDQWRFQQTAEDKGIVRMPLLAADDTPTTEWVDFVVVKKAGRWYFDDMWQATDYPPPVAKSVVLQTLKSLDHSAQLKQGTPVIALLESHLAELRQAETQDDFDDALVGVYRLFSGTLADD